MQLVLIYFRLIRYFFSITFLFIYSTLPIWEPGNVHWEVVIDGEKSPEFSMLTKSRDAKIPKVTGKISLNFALRKKYSPPTYSCLSWLSLAQHCLSGDKWHTFTLFSYVFSACLLVFQLAANVLVSRPAPVKQLQKGFCKLW